MKMKKTNILNDKETFLSAKSWIFTSVILWGADNKIEKKATLSQKTRVIYRIAELFLNSFSHDISHIQVLK